MTSTEENGFNDASVLKFCIENYSFYIYSKALKLVVMEDID